VKDELVFPHDEVDVSFGLHVERSGAEDRGVQPGEGFARGDGVAEDVVGGGSPAQGREGSPLWPLALSQSGEILAGEGDGRLAIGLRTEAGVVGVGPIVDLDEVVFVDQIGEGASVIVTEGIGRRGATGDEFGQMRDEIVASAPLELGREGGRPVSTVGLQGVGEDGEGRSAAKRLEERLADGVEVGSDGSAREGAKDVPFGSDGSALDLLAGVALDEEEGDAGMGRGGDGGGGTGRGEGFGGGCGPCFLRREGI
jgi:hypothetical protein